MTPLGRALRGVTPVAVALADAERHVLRVGEIIRAEEFRLGACLIVVAGGPRRAR